MHTSNHSRPSSLVQLGFLPVIVALVASILMLSGGRSAAAQSAASVSASPDPAVAGSTVTVSGSNYQPGEVVTIGFAGDMTTTTADGAGNISVPFSVDASVPAGAHPLDANGDQGSWAGSSLTITVPAPPPPAPAPPPPPAPPARTPVLSATPNPVLAGATTTVRGSGFAAGESVAVGFAGDMVQATADGNGDLQVVLPVGATVPAMAHPLDANGSAGTSVTISLTVDPAPPAATPSPSPAPAPAPTPRTPAPPTPPATAPPVSPAPTVPPVNTPATPSEPSPDDDDAANADEEVGGTADVTTDVTTDSVGVDTSNDTNNDAEDRDDDEAAASIVVDEGGQSGRSLLQLLLLVVACGAGAGAVALAVFAVRERRAPAA